MIVMNKVEVTAYRFLGCVGSCFTAFQGFFWFLLALIGAMCKYTACGVNSPKRSFGYCFYLTYYYEPQNATANFTRVNWINPTYFHVIMWTNVLLCLANVALSVLTAKAFIEWKNSKEIRKMAYIWSRCIIFFSVCELLMFITFASDIVSIKQKEDVKCFLKTNLTALKSTYLNINERSPAPYLLQLKSNLQTMKKKVRKFKRNLWFMDAVFDDKNPDHVNNPFIPQHNISNYVKDMWNIMFKNNIRDKIRRKSDIIPADEIMRDFLMKEHLDLDEMDYDLLKNFDGLTNNKWMKPIESGNMAFGRHFDLSPSITGLEDSDEIDKFASFLKEYLNNSDNQTQIYPKTDDKFSNYIKELVGKLEEQESQEQQEEIDAIKDFLQEIEMSKQRDSSLPSNKDYEEIQLSLRNFFDNLVPQNKSEEMFMYNIKDFLENFKAIDPKDEQYLSDLIKSLNDKDEINTSVDVEEYVDNQNTFKNDFNSNTKGPDSYLTSLSKKITTLITRNYRSIKPNDDQLWRDIRKSLKNKDEINKTVDLEKYVNTQHTLKIYTERPGDIKNKFRKRLQERGKAKPKAKPKATTKKIIKTVTQSAGTYRNELVKELCENCVYFILAPSIVCMIMSLKTGLVWLLNIVIAVLVIYLGNRITLKKKCKILPCLTKKA